MNNNTLKLKEDIFLSLCETVNKKITLEEYLGTILFFSNRVHSIHFLTKSNSHHSALKQLYEESDEISDGIIENTLASKKINKFIDTGDSLSFSYEKPIDYINNMRIFIIKYRPTFYNENEDSNIYSNIDELLSEIDVCLYRLKNLK